MQEEEAKAQEAANAAKAIKDECEADLAVVRGSARLRVRVGRPCQPRQLGAQCGTHPCQPRCGFPAHNAPARGGVPVTHLGPACACHAGHAS